LPYAVKLADLGYKKACQENSGLRAGINIERGKITNEAVAEAFGLTYHSPSIAA
jgi:alanine dehydrogenase